jgi:N-acetylglucosaminyldiphosphoundecaprenol N-acetyl-beta-D-mannosaminyltransferase
VDGVEQNVKRIKVLNVPVDAVDPDMAVKAVEGLLENGQHNQIVFLSVRGLLKARRDAEFARCIREAALVLPISLAIVSGSRFLGTGPRPGTAQGRHVQGGTNAARLSLYNPFEFVIRVLSLIERMKGSVYLLGSRKEILETAEVNLAGSFHGVRIVGRYYGYFPREIEGNIVTAIKKSSPNLLMVGKGAGGGDKWLLRHKRDFNPGVSLWIGNCLEIFAGKERQPSKKLHAAGLGGLTGIWRKPWKIVFIFPYIWFFLLLLVHRIFKL